MKNPKIFKLFLDTPMYLSHDGLTEMARKAKVKIEELEEGDLLMFLNKAGDKLKILGAQGKVIGYLRMPKQQKIMREALQYIPQTFGANGFNYDAACMKSLTSKLGL